MRAKLCREDVVAYRGKKAETHAIDLEPKGAATERGK